MAPEVNSKPPRPSFVSGNARQAVLARLQERREELAGMGIRDLAIVGSVARDEAGPDSDVDILVEVERPAGLLMIAHSQHYLATVLGREVDLVPSGSVRPQLVGRISREALSVPWTLRTCPEHDGIHGGTAS